MKLMNVINPKSRKTIFLSMGGIFALCTQLLAAVSTSNEDALQLCRSEMTEVHSATSTHDLRVRRHDNVPYVYGVADFDDIEGIKFRCKVFEEQVREVMYLVKDPEYVNGRAWSKERPHGIAHKDLELDDAAMSPPPENHPSPHFVRVPD